MSSHDDRLTAALERIADRLGALGERLGGTSFDKLAAASGEEVITRYAIGKGEVREDGRGLSVRYEVYEDGGGVVGSKVMNGELEGAEGPESLRPPEPVEVRFGDTSEIEVPIPTVRLKARYDFGDRGTLTVVGKGISQLFDLPNGGQVLADVAATSVVAGTGDFQGTQGIVSIIGFVTTEPGEKIPFGQPGAAVQQTSVETFRLLHRR